MTTQVAPSNSDVSQAPTKFKGRWRNVFSLAFAQIVDGSEGGLITALFPVIREALGLSLSSLGILVSVSRVVAIVFGPLWGMAADRFSRKKILVFVTGVWGIWTAIAGLSQSFTMLIILYGIAAIGTVASWPIIQAVVSDMFASDERGKAMGILGGITALIAVVSTPLIGMLANVPDGWRIGFYILGGLSILSGLIMLAFFKEPPRGASEEEISDIADEVEEHYTFSVEDLKKLFKIRSFVYLTIARFMWPALILFSFGITYLVDAYGFETDQATGVFAIWILGFVVGSFGGGFLGDRIDRKDPKLGRIKYMQVVSVLLAILSYLGMQVQWGSDGVFFLIYFVFGLLVGLPSAGVTRPLLAAVTPPELRSSAFAFLLSVAEAIATVVFGLLAGYLGDLIGIKTVFLVMMTMLTLAQTAYWFLFYKSYPEDVENLRKLMAQRRQEIKAAN
jgi:MFS family permease